MKMVLVIWFFVAALVAMGCSPPPDSFGSVGTLQDSWIEIWDWYDLDDVRNNLSGSYILMTDLDSTTAGYEELAGPTANDGKGWEPIGIYQSNHPEMAFTGAFDGQGYDISGLYVNRPDQSNMGLFGCVGRPGTVENLGVINATIDGFWGVGALLGYSYFGTIGNCHSTGSVTGSTARVGGLVGNNFHGVVRGSYSTADVKGSSSVGGLVGGQSGGSLADSYSLGNIQSTSDAYVGGLIGGLDRAHVSNAHYNYDHVLINGETGLTVGALYDQDFAEWLVNGKSLDVNQRLTEVDGCYAIDSVGDLKQLLAFGQDSSLKFLLRSDLDLSDEPNLYVPYLAGQFDGNWHKISNLSVTLAYPYGVGLFGHLYLGAEVSRLGVENVNIAGYSRRGGLAGYSMGRVSKCYSTGSVTGSGSAGGLVGYATQSSVVSECYSTASVSSSGGSVGGLVGFSEGSISNSYSTGSVSGRGETGGALGMNYGGTINNCYSTGKVSGPDREEVGGLVGWTVFPTTRVKNSFWDTETSGIDYSIGGTGKTTAEMKDIRTFGDATWSEGLDSTWDITGVPTETEVDPEYIWNIVDGETYPFLSWEDMAGVQTQCVESATGTGEVCFTTSDGFIEDLEALPSIPPAPPADIVFPHGMFSFKVTGLALGQTVTITVELPEPVPTGTRWWKEHIGAWYSIPVTVIEPNIISFTLTDGVFPGDSDNAEDGVITDPGGPGYPLSLGYTVGWETQPINKFAVSAPWIGLLAAIAGASLLVLRHRQTQS